MFTYVFTGTVLPERANVHIGIPPDRPLSCVLNIPDAQAIQFDASIAINASQVAVVIKSPQQIDDLPTLKNYVEYFVRSVVDAFGYLEGRGYDVEITSLVGQRDGEPWSSLPVWTVYGVEIAGLQETKSERPLSIGEIMPLLFNTPPQGGSVNAVVPGQLRQAIADLREAIRSPHDTGLFCFRAIESIRQCFVLPDDDDDDHKISWIRMGHALRIDETWSKDLAKVSTLQRHGIGQYMSGQEREAAMQRAWKVVDRFMVYVQGGLVPLTEDCDLLQSIW